LALVVASPMLLVIAGFIKATSPGPVIFSQERVGRNGRPFKLHKFRTMYIDAETRLQELLEQNEAQGPMFKMKEDPRITRLGRLLRRTSLDEFPQFFNVLFGEMSVVGPRPPLVREVEQYQTEHLCRLKGRPGITGLWQVSGRSALSFEQMVQLDRHYLENWSISLDLQIIAKTFWVVLARDGAY
jgi:lipopolysaccharide/colanic/teichoic acid biosynthesis glycosyltransferase